MATVYLARDRKHDRLVAIKVLHPELAAVLGADRFLREIRIIAKLSHPHILQLHDSGDADGLLYYVMPFVEGESLRQRLEQRGRLPVATAVQIASEVAAALDYAHQQGIVHRDIKPENILLHTDQAMVSDFGIARAIDAAGGDGKALTALTATGMAIGTPLYMSPEQILGDVVDGRSDVYSLGCVLYEMLAGVPPFSGPSAQAVLTRHTVDPVPSLRKSRADVAVMLEQVTLRALAKTPEDRFASAAAFREALTGGTPLPPLGSRWKRRARLRLTAIAAAALLLASSALLWRFRTTAQPDRSIAVLAFRNMSGDSADEPFSNGMSDEITTALDRVAGLTVAARSTAFGFKGSPILPREVGRRLHVRYVLDGGVRVSGDRRRVSVQLIDVVNGNEVWSDNYDRDARDRDIFAVQDSIARAIVASLRVHLTAAGRVGLTSHYTSSPEAHDLYLKGRFVWAQRGSSGAAALRRAIEYFEQAIALDSNYAQAWSGLADARSMLAAFGDAPSTTAFPQAKLAAQRALLLDSTLADPYTSLGIISLFGDWDLPAARQALNRALALDSTAVGPHQFLAQYYLLAGKLDSSVAELRTALRLDPLSQVLNVRLGTSLTHGRRYAEAEAQYRQALALDSTNLSARTELGTVLGLQHRYPEALAILRALPRQTWDLQGGLLAAAPLGWVEGQSGHRAEALAVQQYLEQLALRKHVAPEAFAWIALGLSDTAAALGWLERAYRERSFYLALLMHPVYDPLRDHPRFQQIVQAVGIAIPRVPHSQRTP